MSGVVEAPAPWKLKGTAWAFILSGLDNNASFPAGFAASHEAEIMTRGGEFIGGQGFVQLVSYSESPVGPYDELIYSPGRWKYPNGEAGFRVTRIYVSSKESTENGRRNWNIPKQVANFDYSPGPDGSTNFSVTMPGQTAPFFKASVKPVPLLSALRIPISTSILGNFCRVVQPPLPQGPNPEEVFTKRWAALTPLLAGKLKFLRIIPGLDDGKVGDGVSFPPVKPWWIGYAIEDLTLDFEVPTWYDEL